MDKTQIRRNIKAMARRMLKDQWGMALLVLIIPILLSAGFSAVGNAISNATASPAQFPADYGAALNNMGITLLFTLAQALILAPVSLGVQAWFVSLTDGRPAPLSVLFSFFDSLQRFGKALGVMISYALRVTLYAILIVGIPVGVATNWLVRYMISSGSIPRFMPYGTPEQYFGMFFSHFFQTVGALPIVLWCLAYLGAVLLLMVFLTRYAPIFYLTVRGPHKRVGELFRESIRLMDGHKLELVWFYLSFFGWALLCLLITSIIGSVIVFFSWRTGGRFPTTLVSLLAGLPFLLLSVYTSTCQILFCEYVEDMARLAGGQAPYTAPLRQEDDPLPTERPMTADAPWLPLHDRMPLSPDEQGLLDLELPEIGQPDATDQQED